MKRYKLSKAAKAEWAAKMKEIENFCGLNGIEYSKNLDSFYFKINDKNVRVSNHTTAASDKGCEWFNPFKNEFEDLRPSYHAGKKYDIEITASKTRIIEIYEDLKAGFELTKRGYRKE
ncbi:MAG: hypothetical protein K2P17_04025 [Helicobacteraceae bacterium]|nr:hypothetical protein [Helicobacteraceae bacterium]